MRPQTRAQPSCAAVASHSLSLDHATLCTVHGPSDWCGVLCSRTSQATQALFALLLSDAEPWLFCQCHRRALASADAVASTAPSGLQAAASTSAVWPTSGVCCTSDTASALGAPFPAGCDVAEDAKDAGSLVRRSSCAVKIRYSVPSLSPLMSGCACSSLYCNPFCIRSISAPTSGLLRLAGASACKLSLPKMNAECA